MKNIKYLLLLVFCFMLVGCGINKAKDISFEAQYIRTDGIIVENPVPEVIKIDSLEDLNEYYDENKENYNFSNNSEASISFLTAIEDYDDAYFSDSFLLIVRVQEDSSDIRHAIDSVKDNGRILISRNMVDNDNSDIATWHIIVELKKDYAEIDYNVYLGNVVEVE